MLLASAVDITVGWLWHTAYRARRHWKLKREGALIAAGFVALVGVVDTARTLHAAAPTATVAIAVPAPQPAPAPVVANAVNITPTAPQPAVSAPPTAQAASDPNDPQFPIIQDQTGSIDQADPVETILPMDPAAQHDDPIARKINERFGDAAAAPAAKPRAKPVKTASHASKPAKPKKPADASTVD